VLLLSAETRRRPPSIPPAGGGRDKGDKMQFGISICGCIRVAAVMHKGVADACCVMAVSCGVFVREKIGNGDLRASGRRPVPIFRKCKANKDLGSAELGDAKKKFLADYAPRVYAWVFFDMFRPGDARRSAGRELKIDH